MWDAVSYPNPYELSPSWVTLARLSRLIRLKSWITWIYATHPAARLGSTASELDNASPPAHTIDLQNTRRDLSKVDLAVTMSYAQVHQAAWRQWGHVLPHVQRMSSPYNITSVQHLLTRQSDILRVTLLSNFVHDIDSTRYHFPRLLDRMFGDCNLHLISISLQVLFWTRIYNWRLALEPKISPMVNYMYTQPLSIPPSQLQTIWQ